jgi:hypothetical protein
MPRRPRPIFCLWDGEHFVPNKTFQAYCDREFVIGEFYPLTVVEERSQASHNHYFAALAEGFNNLNEDAAKRFPTVEHLRHWALIHCGYCTESYFVAANSKEARKIAVDIRKRDPYAVIAIGKDDRLKDSSFSVSSLVRVFDAESQSMAAMKKERFEESKRAVLDLVASMARTTGAKLMQEGKRHGR